MFITRCLKKIAAVLFLAVLISGSVLIFQGYRMYSRGLKEMSLWEMQAQIHEKSMYMPLTEMPETYINGVIAVEDKRFYRHMGIDPVAIGRAVINDIKARSLVEGGSTITQQLAKNMYFDQEKKLARKIAEVFMAAKMENTFSKNEILELYLNSIYFGNGYYSAAEASYGYFGKPPAALNADECIMLAGIPNAPSVYNPVDNPAMAQKRQQQVRARMIKTGFLPAAGNKSKEAGTAAIYTHTTGSTAAAINTAVTGTIAGAGSLTAPTTGTGMAAANTAASHSTFPPNATARPRETSRNRIVLILPTPAARVLNLIRYILAV